MIEDMAKKVNEYKMEIVRALKAAGKYSKGLETQILSLASALRTLDMANDDIDKLEETTVLEETRYGHKLAPHPVFKIQKDAQDSLTRQMKALGLTAEELTGGDDDDPLIDLTKKVRNAGRRKPVIIRRTADGKADWRPKADVCEQQGGVCEQEIGVCEQEDKE